MQHQTPIEMPPSLNSRHALHYLLCSPLDEPPLHTTGVESLHPHPILLGRVDWTSECLSPLRVRGVVVRMRYDDSLQPAKRLDL